MKRRWLAWVFLIGTASLIYFVGNKLPSELAPVEDRSNMSLIAIAPEGVSFEKMKQNMLEVGKYVNDSTEGLDQSYSMVATPLSRHLHQQNFSALYFIKKKEYSWSKAC